MKFNIKTKIDIKEFIPDKIIPKSGSIKKLKIIGGGDNFRLSSLHCNKEIKLPKEIYLTSDDFMAIGLYLAEGTTYYNPNNKIKHCGEVAFVNSSPHCIKLVCQLLSKLNIAINSLSWKIGLNTNYKNCTNHKKLFNYWAENIGLNKNKARPNWIYYSGSIGGRITSNTGKKGCLHIFYSSVIFRNFFVNFIQKIFERSIKNKSKREIALILKGFFAGDGSVNYSAKYNRRMVEFLTNDLDLSNKIRKSLEILGLTSIKETWPESTKTHTKSLRIYNKHDFEILANYDIPNLIKYKRETFSELVDSLKDVKARI